MILQQTIKKRPVEALEILRHFVGYTPLFPIRKVYKKKGVEIYAKLEWQQLGSSVKARPAFNIIKEAILRGTLNDSKILLDATSGNTGIAYATFGAALNIKVTLCVPENISEERTNILRSLGAELIFTSAFESTDGAQIKARELALEFPDKYFYADQYSNDNNWRAHYNGTGEEIYNQTKGNVSHFVAGLGTTGTFTGTGRKLKILNPEIQLIGLQPEGIFHGLEGWKHLESAQVPAIYDDKLADEIKIVDSEKAYRLIKEVAKNEGLLISPSSAANLLGAIELASTLDKGVIVTVFPDNAEKYARELSNYF